jgi:monoamine oxidase
MCKPADFVEWRTPNGDYFVAVCQQCGVSATSTVNGGAALRLLQDKHPTANRNTPAELRHEVAQAEAMDAKRGRVSGVVI